MMWYNVLSHLHIMHGAYPDSPYGLKPGQPLPTQYTDEVLKSGIYSFGSLHACPKSGDVLWKLLRHFNDNIDQLTKAFCNLNIIIDPRTSTCYTLREVANLNE